ncbi:MAG: Pal-related lipoprotein [Bacillus sp. (in: firmicutes)]|jgi:hypothetical protein|nr:Pal-related lipoprotein [Bacillus sp. (in: firmicutes)]
MKGLPLLLLASLLVMTGSCSNSNEKELKIKHDVKQIVFFSNEADYTGEAPYYDALIELKKSFPTEVKKMLVFSPTKAKQYFKTYHIDSCPALLVIYNRKVIVKINGDATKEDIIDPIAEVLSNDITQNQ